MHGMLLRHALVHGIVGQHIYIIAVHAGCLCHFQLLQIAGKGGLCQHIPFFRQFLKQFVLTAYFLARNNELFGVKSAVLTLHVCIFIPNGLQNYIFTGNNHTIRRIFLRTLQIISMNSQKRLSLPPFYQKSKCINMNIYE